MAVTVRLNGQDEAAVTPDGGAEMVSRVEVRPCADGAGEIVLRTTVTPAAATEPSSTGARKDILNTPLTKISDFNATVKNTSRQATTASTTTGAIATGTTVAATTTRVSASQEVVSVITRQR